MCSSSMNVRKIKENFILKLEENCEVCLRKGDLIAIFPPVLHMDPEIYEDPQVTIDCYYTYDPRDISVTKFFIIQIIFLRG